MRRGNEAPREAHLVLAFQCHHRGRQCEDRRSACLVGLVAGDGGALIWPQLIGNAKAKHYLFTGDLMTAAEAERLGLITKVVPAAELDATAYGYAERLMTQPRKALQWTKVTANLPLKALFHAHFDTGVAYETVSNRTADHQEAVLAFREKRKPRFSGS